MLLCVFLLLAAASSLVVAENCYDVPLFIKHKLKPAHNVCTKELARLEHNQKDGCYFAYRKCVVREWNFINEAGGADHEKLLKFLLPFATNKDGFRERFTKCADIPATPNKLEDYFTCINNNCPGGDIVRVAFTRSAIDFCM